MIMKDYKTDEGLQGNEKIEEAIAGLQHEATQEMLAHTLTVIRRRMKDAGQLIIAVEPPSGDGQLRLEAVRTEDGDRKSTRLNSSHDCPSRMPSSA